MFKANKQNLINVSIVIAVLIFSSPSTLGSKTNGIISTFFIFYVFFIYFRMKDCPFCKRAIAKAFIICPSCGKDSRITLPDLTKVKSTFLDGTATIEGQHTEVQKTPFNRRTETNSPQPLPIPPSLATMKIIFGLNRKNLNRLKNWLTLCFLFITLVEFGCLLFFLYTTYHLSHQSPALTKKQLESVQTLPVATLKGQFPKCSTLVTAVIQNIPQTAEYLLNQGFDPNEKCYDNLLVLQFESNKVKNPNLMLDEFFSRKKYYAPLLIAAANGKNDLIKILLDHNADIHIRNRDKNTALVIASNHGFFSTVDYLLSRGSDINSTNDQGETALHQALRKKFTDMAFFLIKKGANLNLKDQGGETPVSLIQKLGLALLSEKITQLELSKGHATTSPSETITKNSTGQVKTKE